LNDWHNFSEAINLHVEGRITGDDAHRQERSAREILRRLAAQPGVVLADEVGMGKTFVALAVADRMAISPVHSGASSQAQSASRMPTPLKSTWFTKTS